MGGATAMMGGATAMSNPIYYRLYTNRGSLTLRSPKFVELHELMLQSPKALFTLQLGSLAEVKRVDWTPNGADWVTMGKSSVATAFARVIIAWSRGGKSAIPKAVRR